jgi:glycoside/pentoside/hexuronide:cation symporter, GPH family
VNGSLAATPAAPQAPATGWRDGWRSGLSYGALGLPLAFVALPLYVVLPNHYAEAFGVPLAWLGALLLAARLLDAFVDPWIGRQCDRWFAHSTPRVLAISVGAALALAVSFVALFFPPMRDLPGLLAWCGATLAACYLSYSLLSIVHQSWGARLGGDAPQRARIVSWREGLSLAGVLLASVLSSTLGLGVTSAVLAVSLVLALGALWNAPRATAGLASAAETPMRLALANPSFRRLLGVYLVNGIASAIPATLVLFFIRDRLQALAYEPLFLGSYFLAAALSMPLWLRAVSRFGLARSWRAGMLLAIASFVWAAGLGAGDVAAFVAVCVASGVALGADLGLPGALLAGVIRRAGHQGRSEGMYFGWWNFATKLNLALAAGITLPLLGLFGYAPGSRDAGALDALTLAYCALPCVLKLAAVALLYFGWMRSPEGSTE